MSTHVDRRALPRSLDPLPDESIHGYLLRLAHRLDLTPARLVALTGLNLGHRNTTTAASGMIVQVTPAARQAFAHATRLTAIETDSLFLSSFADRYPPARPTRAPTRWGSTTHIDRWLFTRSTRYCPACLAGDSTELSRVLGGPWRRTWRLPVVVVCPEHSRFLDHHCLACHQLVHQHGQQLPGWHTTALHPTQCRALTERGARRTQHSGCATRLSGPSIPEPPAPEAVLQLQQRILAALDDTQPDQIPVLGRDTAAACYFVDLQLISYLLRASWPLGRDLVPDPVLTDALDAYLANAADQFDRANATTGAGSSGSNGYNMRLHQMHKSPPLDAVACAALLAAADRLLTLANPLALTEQLRVLLAHDDRRPGKAVWSRDFLARRPDCSEQLRQAVAPILQTYARTRRPRRLLAPIRHTPFGPEHIAQFLQQDWFDQHFTHFDGIKPVHLRRAAALHLCQLAAGGSIKQAAQWLGYPDTPAGHDRGYSSAKTVHRWAKLQPDPHAFDLALHALADHLEATPHLINYQQRRAALHGWCLDVDTWQHLLTQLPPHQPGHGTPHQRGDRKRQSTSVYVWALVTGSEHILAPHPLRDRQPADQHNAWRLSDYSFCARMHHAGDRANNRGPHDVALHRVLTTYARGLAAHIDTTGHTGYQPPPARS